MEYEAGEGTFWLVFVTMVSMVVLYLTAWQIPDEIPPRLRKVIRLGAPVVFLTAWLFMPWVCLGVIKVYRWNMNKLNYVQRPDTVTPVPGQTYRADQRPVE